MKAFVETKAPTVDFLLMAGHSRPKDGVASDQRTDKHPEIPLDSVRSDFDPALTRGGLPGSGEGTGRWAFNIP
jgi:hypothetical protein